MISPLSLLAFSLRHRLAAMTWLELVLWFGLASLTFALLFLMGTRWGQVRPVSKCVALSVFAHILFLTYAYGTKLTFSGGWSLEPTVNVTIVGSNEDEADWDGTLDPPLEAADSPPALAAVPVEPVEMPEPADEPPALANEPEAPAAPPMVEMATTAPIDPPALLAEPEPLPDPEMIPDIDNSAPPIVIDEPPPATSPPPALVENTPSNPPAAVEPPSANEPVPQPAEQIAPAQDPSAPLATGSQEATAERPDAPAMQRLPDQTASVQPSTTPHRPADEQPVPAPYRNRGAENRLQLAIPFGATESSEAAVQAALLWLAAVQGADGRWDASQFGAGRETKTLGHDRQGAGEDADTGITGLALLAMLGAGNTHIHGEHRECVQHGLEYLLRIQAADGNLYGPAKLYERMYCHGIATLALGEAFAMTGDPRLQPALRRAIGYTVSSQHAGSGGWRYQPGDRGDVSQFGWQVMALRSAELGGIPIDGTTRELMTRFLSSALSGPNKGLAGYRPGERPTRTMTAEAMACRFFMQTPPPSAAAQEATAFVMQELPGSGQPNLYYWYYATLALFQDQGPAWATWNRALQDYLIAGQRRDGGLAGSWDTDDVWGGYGGRIYTTAMAALCLEVYYRYLPLYDLDTSRQAGAIRVVDPLRRR